MPGQEHSEAQKWFIFDFEDLRMFFWGDQGCVRVAGSLG